MKPRRAFTLVELAPVSESRRPAFTLVELLVVLGIIALLISILMPTLNKARQQAKRVQCASNLRQCGVSLLLYAQENNGWIVPVGDWDPNSGPIDPNTGKPEGEYFSLGSNELQSGTPWLTWPAVVFKMNKANPAVLDPAAYAPDIMRCPQDVGVGIYDPNRVNGTWGGHSYVINKHLAKSPGQIKKYGSKMGSGLDVSHVPLLGEKVIGFPDYYLEQENNGLSEFENLIDLYKHGTKATLGANYLFMDLHVDSKEPTEAYGALDPWDVATTQPAGNGHGT